MDDRTQVCSYDLAGRYTFQLGAGGVVTQSAGALVAILPEGVAPRPQAVFFFCCCNVDTAWLLSEAAPALISHIDQNTVVALLKFLIKQLSHD